MIREVRDVASWFQTEVSGLRPFKRRGINGNGIEIPYLRFLRNLTTLAVAGLDWIFTFVPSGGNVHADIFTPVAFSESPPLLFPLTCFLLGVFMTPKSLLRTRTPDQPTQVVRDLRRRVLFQGYRRSCQKTPFNLSADPFPALPRSRPPRFRPHFHPLY